ncbi:hypothetical protein HD554DRAFT_2039847 [Boletus coccyginus]|nr:hypothetical protein HD554DRAFT_2039847 [Boletus coccyginus]
MTACDRITILQIWGTLWERCWGSQLWYDRLLGSKIEGVGRTRGVDGVKMGIEAVQRSTRPHLPYDKLTVGSLGWELQELVTAIVVVTVAVWQTLQWPRRRNLRARRIARPRVD